jgi:hypothetical protein
MKPGASHNKVSSAALGVGHRLPAARNENKILNLVPYNGID